MPTVEEKQRPILNPRSNEYEQKIFVYNTDAEGNTIAPPVSKRVEILTQEQVDAFYAERPEFLRQQTILAVDDVMTAFVVEDPQNPGQPITTLENMLMRNKFLSIPDVQVWLSRGTNLVVSKEVLWNVKSVVDLCAQVDPTSNDIPNSQPVLSGVPLTQLRALLVSKEAELEQPL